MDGRLSLSGMRYHVPPHVLDALKKHPGSFLMGNLGPDVFPDPLVGQTTTHPGVVDGWGTGEWLDLALSNADSPDEIAFAFGFAVHAASDMFAHTYVNQYAGDLFELIDDEREVELRHFVLEKYIEHLTPEIMDSNGNTVNFNTLLRTPESFLSKSFILNRAVSNQNLKAKTGLHLTAMHDVKRAVNNAEDITSDVNDKLVSFSSETLKKQVELTTELASGKLAIKTAQASLKIHETELQIKEEALELAKSALSEANKIVQKNPELISVNHKLLGEQAKLAANLLAESIKVAAEVDNVVNGFQSTINGLADDLADLVCDIIGGVVSECDNLKDDIKKLRNGITAQNLKKETAAKLAKEAKNGAENLTEIIDKLQKEYDEAVKNLANGTYVTSIDIAKKELELQKKLVKVTKETLEDAEKLVDKIEKELNVLNNLIEEIERFLKRFDAISFLLGNWAEDIKNSTEKYIKASHYAGKKMLSSSGNPLKEYLKWYECSGQVFVAVPEEIGEGTCAVRDFLTSIKSEYDSLINDLPEELQWLVNPTGKAKDLVMKEIKPELEKAEKEILGFLTDKNTAEFLLLLSDSGNIKKSKLDRIYSNDQSGKGLLVFNKVSELIDKDLDIIDGKLNPNSFIPLKNSLTMAKLSLLGVSQLNNLIKDNLGSTSSPYYGDEVYKSDKVNFSLLVDAIKNIDGNHQWQAFGLPYPRKIGASHTSVGKLQFGYNYYEDKSKGLKIFVDPYLRDKVFIPLFSGSMTGALLNRKELKPPQYKFVECLQNPYPSTQNMKGNLLTSDNTCANLSQPDTEFIITFSDSLEYEKRYFQMEDAVEGSRFWTSIGSFIYKKEAIKFRNNTVDKFPDIYCEVWEPNTATNNKYWTVMMAAGTSQERAQEVKDISIRRRISLDAFTWEPTYPWKKYTTDPVWSTNKLKD